MSLIKIEAIPRFDIIDFLEEYQKFPCLWKKSDPNFKNRSERDAAETYLLQRYNFASAKELRQKIRSVRGTYNQERNKVRNSLRNGTDVYKPKLIWFDLADSFLRQNELENDNDTSLMTEEDECPLTEVEKEEDTDSPVHSQSESASNPYQLSVSNFQQPTVSEPHSRMIFRNQKRKRERGVPQNRRNLVKLVDSLDNAVNVLKEVSSRSPCENNNEFIIFGNHVASQLQTLPLAEALQLQSEIQSLITSVRVQCLQNASSAMSEPLITTVQPQCVVTTLAEPCQPRGCNRKYMPVCGERVVNGKLEKKNFGNYCMMEAANDCGQGYSICSHQEDEDQDQEQ